MPTTKRSDDIDRRIADLHTAIAALCVGGGQNDPPKLEKLLGALAKLKAERTRLMMHQTSIPN